MTDIRTPQEALEAERAELIAANAAATCWGAAVGERAKRIVEIDRALSARIPARDGWMPMSSLPASGFVFILEPAKDGCPVPWATMWWLENAETPPADALGWMPVPAMLAAAPTTGGPS